MWFEYHEAGDPGLVQLLFGSGPATRPSLLPRPFLQGTIRIIWPAVADSLRYLGAVIICGFSIAYMISNPLWGWILDRAGLRRGMTAAVAGWTVASVAHVCASGFWSLSLARATLGIGEGAAFPGGLRTVVWTLPPDQRSRSLAVSHSGGSLGAVVTLWWFALPRSTEVGSTGRKSKSACSRGDASRDAGSQVWIPFADQQRQSQRARASKCP